MTIGEEDDADGREEQEEKRKEVEDKDADNEGGERRIRW